MEHRKGCFENIRPAPRFLKNSDNIALAGVTGVNFQCASDPGHADTNNGAARMMFDHAPDARE